MAYVIRIVLKHGKTPRPTRIGEGNTPTLWQSVQQSLKPGIAVVEDESLSSDSECTHIMAADLQLLHMCEELWAL